MDKYEFSSEDYLMYKCYFVNKENEIVGVVSKNVNQRHDKSFKDILKNKSEMSKFLKQFIEMEVNSEELQIYNSEFINKQYEKRISDIIYKVDGKDIYYLIEHQSKVDKEMPHRILEYCMELMKEIKENQEQKDGSNPLIVPIVIYTGEHKWKVTTNFSDTQKVEEKYKEYAIKLKYKLVDVNKYTKEELKIKDTKMTSMMILEKCKSKEELRETIIELSKNKKRTKWLIELVTYIFNDMLGEEAQEIIKILEGEEKSSMEDLIERIKKNEAKKEKKLISQGKIDAIIEIIRNMIRLKQDDETIMKFTNAKKEEIEKARKELQVQM